MTPKPRRYRRSVRFDRRLFAISERWSLRCPHVKSRLRRFAIQRRLERRCRFTDVTVFDIGKRRKLVTFSLLLGGRPWKLRRLRLPGLEILDDLPVEIDHLATGLAHERALSLARLRTKWPGKRELERTRLPLPIR